jgi:hypothetical protein
MRIRFWVESMNHSDNLRAGGKILLKQIFGNRVWGCGLDHLAQDMDRWRALMNTAMNPLVP